MDARKRGAGLILSWNNERPDMTPNRAKELLPIITAFSEGKQIEWKYGPGATHWKGPMVNAIFYDQHEYRIKPELKLRPWKREEFPVNDWFRRKASPDSWFICTRVDLWAVLLTAGWVNFLELLNFFEHSNDGCKTWLPCGVLE